MVGIVLTAALVACTSGGGGGYSGTGSSFTRQDLDAIVLTAVDAPDGTEYAASVSGFQDLAGFASDADEADALVADDFRVGHLALFAPEGHAEPGQGAPLPPDAAFAQGITALFGSGDGASRSLRRFVDSIRTEELRSVNDDPKPLGFGDESFAVDGETADGSHVLLYAWRDGNLVLAIGGAGSMPPTTVRSLAQTVQNRATG
jgi:hypothetical protein